MLSRESVTLSEATPTLTYAGLRLRLAAVLGDTIVLAVPSYAFRWLFAEPETSALFEVMDFLQVTVIWAVYYGVLESSKYQATLGKMFFRLKVVDLTGRRISFGRAASRFLGSLVAVLPLGIGLLMIGFTGRKQGLHDMMARCLVVRETSDDLFF